MRWDNIKAITGNTLYLNVCTLVNPCDDKTVHTRFQANFRLNIIPLKFVKDPQLIKYFNLGEVYISEKMLCFIHLKVEILLASQTSWQVIVWHWPGAAAVTSHNRQCYSGLLTALVRFAIEICMYVLKETDKIPLPCKYTLTSLVTYRRVYVLSGSLSTR